MNICHSTNTTTDSGTYFSATDVKESPVSVNSTENTRPIDAP